MDRKLNHPFALFSPFAVLRVLALALAMIAAECSASAETFDWRKLGSQANHSYLAAVRNQGAAGCCWAFATVGALEARYNLTRYDWSNNDALDLSEEYLAVSGLFGGTVDGGDAGAATEAVRTGSIVVREAELQYTATSTPVSGQWPLQSGWQSRAAALTSEAISGSGSVSTIKTLLKKYGPLAVNTSSYFGGGHSVVIAGFDDSFVVSSTDTGAFIIKNSWGTGWSAGGQGAGYGIFPYSEVKSGGGLYAFAMVGQAYYTGAMTNATWTGGNGNWIYNGNTWSTSGGAYKWENRETQAIFSNANQVTLTGDIWAYGIQFAAGSGGVSLAGNYRLTVTAGGIDAQDNVTISNLVTVGAPATWTVASGKTVTIAGPVDLHISPLKVSGSGNTIISGPVRDVTTNPEFANLLVAATTPLTKTGEGTLTLSGTNTYSGGTIISNSGGILIITSPRTLGTGSVTIAKSAYGSGTLQLALAGNNTITNSFAGFRSTTFSSAPRPCIQNVSGTNKITSALTVAYGGGNGIVMQSDAGMLELAGTTSATLTSRGIYLTGAGNGLVSGPVTDGAGAAFPLRVEKHGIGTWTLSGVNTYSGTTTNNAGTLQVNGKLAGGAVTVTSGATLGGTGTIGGAVTIQSGGTLSPGASLGALTINNNLTLAGNLFIELNKSSSPSNDLAVVSGSLTNAGAGTVTVTNLGLTALAPGDRFPLFNKPLLNGQALTITPAPGSGLAWTNKLAVDGSIAVVSTVIPPVPATNLAIVAAGPASFRVSGLGGANQAYGLYACTNVAAPMINWWLIGVTNADSGGVIQFLDTQATNAQRFYRFGQ